MDGTVEALRREPLSNEEALAWGNPEVLELWTRWEELEVSKGVLFKKWEPCNRVTEIWQAVVPKSMRQEIMYQLHEASSLRRKP